MIQKNLGIALLTLLALAVLSLSAAAEPGVPSSETDALIKQEKLRAEVEAIFTDLFRPPHREETAAPLFTWITERLLALGPSVAPLMEAEIDSKNRATLNVAAYVLGFQRAPGVKETLVKAAEAADREGGDFGRDRKVWLGYALALTGDPDAVDLLDSGKLNCIRKEFVTDMSVLEVASILTAPSSTAKLLQKLERYARSDDPETKTRLYVVLHALRRVADPSIRDRVLPYLEHEEAYVRDGAARALAATGDPSVVDPLIAALDDPEPFSRFGVASALEELKPAGKTKEILARLEVERYPAVRGALYRTLAATGGESAIPALARQWGTDAMDRVFLVDAVGAIRSKKGINLLRNALSDQDARVVLHAMGALAAIGGPGPADTLLALLKDPRPSVAAQATQLLVGLSEKRAAARIGDSLRPMLATPLTNVEERDPLFARGDALVSLGATDLLDDVRASVEIQPDPTVADYLRSLDRRMTALSERGDDPQKWIDALSSDDLELRLIAHARLAELRSPAAVKPLLEAFGRVDVEDGIRILGTLAAIAPPDAAPLLERVLLDPAFDAEERKPLRGNAAWAATRLGGPRMAEALRKAAERREGRDALVLVYLAVLTGRDAVPVLESLRVPRMRWFDWRRGPEQERLDWIVRELKAGRSIGKLAVSPDDMARL